MSCSQSNQSGCSFPQRLVNQSPSYDKRITKEKRPKMKPMQPKPKKVKFL